MINYMVIYKIGYFYNAQPVKASSTFNTTWIKAKLRETKS